VLGLLRRNRLERPAYLLYGTAVAAARASWFYTGLDVADSVEGRFDMVSLHVFLVIRRLGQLPAPGPAMAQAVFDAMFNDMDVNLREMGVGDLAVGKRNRALWEAFHGRSAAYQEALAAADDAALETALARNVWRGKPPAGAAARLAEHVRACAALLAAQEVGALAAGRVVFSPVPA
jgi:cytochrome b pre-mRNA-processing protein 3